MTDDPYCVGGSLESDLREFFIQSFSPERSSNDVRVLHFQRIAG